ncbi:protein ced-11-like [Uloborus diversus]|uniref:protein ced-11-like n=1 Tax=Uloborus diversus TaxID=327109 RepID=UPI00240A05AA|nr:protein ced-11-like [Uloborus diversus]
MSSLLLNRLSFYVTQEEAKDKIVNLSKEFATMAFNVFDLCYNDSPSKAYNNLDTRSHEWSGLSIIDVASQAKNFDFVSHPCCQKWLTNKFMGNIKLREINWGFVTFPSYFKVLFCAFFIFPMFWWVRFKEKSDDTDRDDYNVDETYHSPEEQQLITVSSNEETTTSPIAKYRYPPIRLMIYWMWSAPITRFYVSNMFYFLFLMAFSAAVMWPSCGNLYLDITICAWTLLIAVDTSYRIYASHKALHNISLFRPCLEIVYMISFALFYFLFRVSNLNIFQDPYAGKVISCLGLLYFYYRTTVMFVPVSSTLGPLLYRVKRMMSVDFINFMKLALIIILGNGLAMQAVLYPDYPLTLEMVRKLFHKAFIALFMTPTDELTKDPSKCIAFEEKPTDRTICRINDYVDGTCYSGKNFWSYLFVFQYILLMKLVLITVLMALYTNTSAKNRTPKCFNMEISTAMIWIHRK